MYMVLSRKFPIYLPPFEKGEEKEGGFYKAQNNS